MVLKECIITWLLVIRHLMILTIAGRRWQFFIFEGVRGAQGEKQGGEKSRKGEERRDPGLKIYLVYPLTVQDHNDDDDDDDDDGGGGGGGSVDTVIPGSIPRGVKGIIKNHTFVLSNLYDANFWVSTLVDTWVYFEMLKYIFENITCLSNAVSFQLEYGVAEIDGHEEKIGNFRIEPPGLFRGRGEHPKQVGILMFCSFKCLLIGLKARSFH